ncbi:MAG: 3-deoxy-manno-octulosonate cytidylyltransferase [Elusimicrobiota bacterium]
MNIKIIGVIPSRYASTRLPGKALIKFAGKTLIHRVWLRAVRAKLIDKIVIATDDKRIFDEVKSFGGNVVMTSTACRNGTERCAEVVKTCPADAVVNIQGDEPMIAPSTIDALARELRVYKDVYMATAAVKIVDTAEKSDPNVVKVVFDKHNDALYFSRSVIPFPREGNLKQCVVYKHLGIYAYKTVFLKKLSVLPPTKAEVTEKLEQLRVLENGYKIRVAVVKYDSIGVDTLADVRKLRKVLA